ncbi:MAG TPA: response regulator [Usitatibacter sp.]|jgi:two-component system response regulator|nr:response regulator [Usitatibacter sp.]
MESHDKEPRILLVEDDHADREKTLEALRKHGLGYEVRFVAGPHEALDYLLARGRFHERRRHPMPDLVLLDMSLAPLDGLRVLRRIREVESLRSLPVVILCTTAEERERAMVDAVRAHAYAMKPVSADDMRDLLRMTYPSMATYAAMRFE